jgi:hypothetical protein
VLEKVGVLHRLAWPYLYFLFILWLPYRMNRSVQMIIAAGLGFTIDAFRHQPGFHMAACVLIAYIRPFLIPLFIPQNSAEASYEEPSPKSMGGFLQYVIFVSVFTIIHHGWLFLLEAWQVGNIWYFLAKTFLSTIVSILLIIITELIFSRKQQFRTNKV